MMLFALAVGKQISTLQSSHGRQIRPLRPCSSNWDTQQMNWSVRLSILMSPRATEHWLHEE